MSYLAAMTEDEIRYICSAIPVQEAVGYFKRYPEDFAKIMPGFRATSLRNREQISGVLFRSRNQHYISSFIERHIGRWLDEIGSATTERINSGESKESALLQTLPHCYFVDNIELYFKLIGEECTEEFLALLSESIRTIKDASKECEQANVKLEAEAATISRLETELAIVRTEQGELNQKLSERVAEMKALKQTNSELEKCKSVIISLEQTIVDLKLRAQERENFIKQLKSDLSVAKAEQLQLEQKIREELAKQIEAEKYGRDISKKPLRPKDLDEFKDYLGYNFENIGISSAADYYLLLKDHLCEILFQGRPIVVSRSTGLSLMRCISNTLVKTPVVSTLAFTSEVEEKSVDAFLSQDNRIVCLDNFIGNFNETTLIAICDKHRGKIIFLTAAYDHTLAYVPDEFMRYCHYLNLNRTEAFIGDKELTEDPSAVDEAEVEGTALVPDVRWSAVLKEMLDELGIRGALSEYKKFLVTDELSFCRLLVFDILPYCSDVLKIAPFNTSERLGRYAGDNGRCPYRDLFRRWFA